MPRILAATLVIVVIVALSPSPVDAKSKMTCVLEPVDETAFFDIFVGDEAFLAQANWTAMADCPGTALDGLVAVEQLMLLRRHGQLMSGPTQLIIGGAGGAGSLAARFEGQASGKPFFDIFTELTLMIHANGARGAQLRGSETVVLDEGALIDFEPSTLLIIVEALP